MLIREYFEFMFGVGGGKREGRGGGALDVWTNGRESPDNIHITHVLSTGPFGLKRQKYFDFHVCLS